MDYTGLRYIQGVDIDGKEQKIPIEPDIINEKDIDALIVDHELRLALLELNTDITESEVS